MVAVVYNVAKLNKLQGGIDYREAGDDIRVLLLEANSDINPDDLTVAAVLGRAGTTELTSTGYARQALGNQAVTQDDAADRAEFDADNAVFTGVSQLAAETVTGYLVFKHVTNDADSIPIFFDDTATGLPLTPNGSDITITWHADGILHVQQA